jgi:hypothetical protein
MDSDVELVARAISMVLRGGYPVLPIDPSQRISLFYWEKDTKMAQTILTALRSAGWQKLGPDQVVVNISAAPSEVINVEPPDFMPRLQQAQEELSPLMTDYLAMVTAQGKARRERTALMNLASTGLIRTILPHGYA